jgi:hypothetical protein
MSDLFTQAADLLDQHVPTPEPVAHARSGDRATSHEAAASVTNLTAKQQAVLECIAMYSVPVADVEWIEGYKQKRWVRDWPMQPDSGLRTRRDELTRRPTGQRRVVEAGSRYIGKRRHTLWRVEDASAR